MQVTRERLVALRSELPRRIRGQDEPLDRLMRAIERRELQAVPQLGPRSSFLFAGPTGVGKTESAEVIAEVLFDQRELLRIDCSEYQTLASFEGLLGNRSGYRGRLGTAYDRCPYGIWLWDEIEKAHPNLIHLFLQMSGAARLTLACGDSLDLRGFYLIVTSNLGSAEIIGRDHLTFTSLERHVVRCIEQYFRPELLGRFEYPFVFRPLSRKAQAEITEQHFRQVLAYQQQLGRQVRFEPEVLSFLIHRGFSPRLGARRLLHFIHQSVGDAVAANLLAGGTGTGSLIVNGERLILNA